MTRTDWNDYDWQLIHEAPQRPALHMALDAVITDEVGAGTRPPTLRIWEWSAPAVVIGRFQSLKNEVDPEGARRHGIEVVRRVSGGGAMFVEPGNTITYSLSVPQALVHGMSFQESYEFLDGWVIRALHDLGIKAWYQPLNDIASEAGKIGGAAQARRGGAVLHHVTMSYDIDAEKMVKVLRIGRAATIAHEEDLVALATGPRAALRHFQGLIKDLRVFNQPLLDHDGLGHPLTGHLPQPIAHDCAP